MLASTASGIPALTVLFGVASILGSVALQSALLAVVCAPLIVCANLLMWRRVALWPITPKAAQQNAQATWWVTIVTVLLALLG